MTDYSKVCWYCGKPTVFPVKSYFECTDCGATWNEVPELGPSPLIQDVGLIRDGEGTIITHARRTRSLRKPKAQARSGAK